MPSRPTRARRPLRIGIVAAEASGDLLGAGLIRALRRRLPDAEFTGIGGPLMQAEGCRSLYPMEALTLIGLGDLGKLFSILSIRRRLREHFLRNPPDAFIGVDAPDFNLAVEEGLRAAGIPTVHYVSPTVWAWRGYRIRRIRRAADLMLTLFPFEERYYERQHMRVAFVGHPLADVIPLRYDAGRTRRGLDLPRGKRIVALLPGSRRSELERHAELFVRTAAWLAARRDDLHFVAPFVNETTRAIFRKAVDRLGASLPLTSLLGNSREVMAASDVVLLASGTATLEAGLLRKPMVVTYRLPWLTYRLVRLFSHVEMYSLPNNLAGRRIVPELLQHDATPEKCGAAIEVYLEDAAAARAGEKALAAIHRSLRRNASLRAAQAVMALLRDRGKLALRRRPRHALAN
jgi:lipid-A-disaccharide synthase